MCAPCARVYGLESLIGRAAATARGAIAPKEGEQKSKGVPHHTLPIWHVHRRDRAHKTRRPSRDRRVPTCAGQVLTALLLLQYRAGPRARRCVVVAGALAFDYAPASTRVSHGGTSRRIWFNVSQARVPYARGKMVGVLQCRALLLLRDKSGAAAFCVSRGAALLHAC